MANTPHKPRTFRLDDPNVVLADATDDRPRPRGAVVVTPEPDSALESPDVVLPERPGRSRWGALLWSAIGGLVSLGMGLYLSAATLNQALLAHERAKQSAGCWGACAVAFVLFLLLVEFDDPVLQVEVAFLGAAALLAGSLYALYRRA